MTAEDSIRLIRDKLELMTKARPSIYSHLKGKYLKQLPVTVLMSSLNASDTETSDRYEKILQKDAAKGKTLMDYSKGHSPLQVQDVVYDGATLTFEDATMEIAYQITEVARGDFDADGFEDAVLEIGWHTEGTMGGSYTATVTRTGLNQKLRWVH